MAFKDFSAHEKGIALLKRSLECGRLAHAYMFSGPQLDELEPVARTLAKTLNCEQPVMSGHRAVDCCDGCSSCLKIEGDAHPDAHWVRPESKTCVILIQQVRELIRELNLKPAQARYKVGVIVGADRLGVQSGNAFLKTLEEPPARSVLILLTTDPQRVLETIASRCIRLSFGAWLRAPDAERLDWLARFGEAAVGAQGNLLARYRLIGFVADKLASIRTQVESALKASSPLIKYTDYAELEPELRERWEKELEAAIEAAYRQRRASLIADLQRWFRDVWLQTLGIDRSLLGLPQNCQTSQIARRITAGQAVDNLRMLEQLQWCLGTNVQENLALEIGLLKLHI